MTRRTVVWIEVLGLACGLAMAAAPALAQDDLCGRPREAPEAMFQRLTKTEKLAESFRDKGYVTINDATNGTIWTFTVAGHPPTPRQSARAGGGGRQAADRHGRAIARPRRRSGERLVRGFEALNHKMLKDAEKKPSRATRPLSGTPRAAPRAALGCTPGPDLTASAPLPRDGRGCPKNRAWLMMAFTFWGWNGLVTRKVGSGGCP